MEEGAVCCAPPVAMVSVTVPGWAPQGPKLPPFSQGVLGLLSSLCFCLCLCLVLYLDFGLVEPYWALTRGSTCLAPVGPTS